jgi:predicted O-methyltransferase YrrM
MRIEIATEDVNRYMRALLDRHDEPVLLEMEELARQKEFPIINRHVGVTVEILARAIGARKVFELGSGYGYSAFWFARAVGQGGEVHCTDGDPQNAKKAQEFLSRANLWGRITFHVGDALTLFSEVAGKWDIVYDDISKEGYPEAWKAACNRIRVGGLYICDNVIAIASAKKLVTDDTRDERIEAIREHNKNVASDSRYLSSILPIREGLMVAYRLR